MEPIDREFFSYLTNLFLRAIDSNVIEDFVRPCILTLSDTHMTFIGNIL